MAASFTANPVPTRAYAVSVANAKRHHYVPEFLLRRFNEDPSNRKSLLWRLPTKGPGKPERANPRNEAVIGHYNTFVFEDGRKDGFAEETLSHIDGAAAEAIKQLTEGAELDDEQWLMMAFFVVLAKSRTPLGRSWLRFNDETLAKTMMETQLSQAEGFAGFWNRATGEELSDDEAEAMRQELLGDLSEGRLVIESPHSREVALMFIALEKTAPIVAERLTWTVLRAPAGSQFILGDTPLALYDPAPRVPDGGVGFLSSEHVETTLPLDPSCCLMLTPGDKPWHEAEAKPEVVESINLRSYAWAQQAIYGPSQAAVTGVRALVKRQREQLARYLPKAGALWFGEETEEGTRWERFTPTPKRG
jgi:hypothetical protein